MAGKPLQLVRCDDAGRFMVCDEARERLRDVRGPLAVVTVCGRARQGKSFILNQLAQHGHLANNGGGTPQGKGTAKGGGELVQGFEVAATHRPCTKVSAALGGGSPPVGVVVVAQRAQAQRSEGVLLRGVRGRAVACTSSVQLVFCPALF